MTTTARAALAILLIAAFAAAAFFIPTRAKEPPGPPAIVRIDEGPLRYTFHVVTATDALFDIGTDPKCLKNLAAERPADVKRMRGALTRKLGLKDLSDLQEGWREIKGLLNELGYF